MENLARQATDEEESWLEIQDRLSQAQQEWVCKESLIREPIANQCQLEREAEEYDNKYELMCCRRAEEEASLLQEAEEVHNLEVEEERELVELMNVENAGRYQMMKDLIDGASYLIQKELAQQAPYQKLVSVRRSAQELLSLVDDSIFQILERERVAAKKQVERVVRIKKESEAAALAERLQLQSEVAQLKENEEDLLELLDQEKDRTICRICFARPRDVLPLPCMHFEYCCSCLEKYQKARNICPTCRCPISGVLKCNLTIG